MKKFILGSLIVLGWCVAAMAADTRHYVNSDYKIELDFPSDWTHQDGPNVTKGVALKIFIPRTPTDVYTKNVYVEVQEPKPSLTLDQYRGILEQQMVKFMQAKILRTEETTLANRAAFSTVFSMPVESLTVQLMIVYTVKDEKIYLIGYGSTAEDFEKHLPEVQEIFRSFEIK